MVSILQYHLLEIYPLKRGIDNTKEQNREREKSTEIEVYQVYGSGDLSMG